MEIVGRGILPVKAIAVAVDDSKIYWANAGTLYCFNMGSYGVQSVCLMNFDCIQGIRCCGEDILVHGGKRLCLVCPSMNLCNMAFFGPLDDLILDAISFEMNGLKLVAVGQAHNFIDVQITKEKVPFGNNLFVSSTRFRCPTLCVLFSMSIRFQEFSNDLLVASGTAFGELVMWKCELTNISNGNSSCQILHKFNSHEGVIFRCVWSRDNHKLLSVSDDRTFRLWDIDNHQELMVGWGHIARVWDATFIGQDERLIATSGEDAVVKLWNLLGQCLSTLRGHNTDIWRLVWFKWEGSSILITGGNDGQVNTWDLNHHLVCSPEESGSIDETACLGFPSLPISNSLRDCIESGGVSNVVVTSDSRRSNGVNHVAISPCGRFVVVVQLDGIIWIVEHESAYKYQNLPIDSAIAGWNVVSVVPKPVTASAVEFVVKETAQVFNGAIRYEVISACAHFDGTISLVRCNHEHCHAEVRTWKAHDFRAINIWILRTDADYILTSCAKGHCRLWRLACDDCNEPSLFIDCLTGGKQQIASASCFLSSVDVTKDSCLEQCQWLLIGDTRGGISYYYVRAVRNEDAASSISPLLPEMYSNLVHSTDPVTFIWTCKGGFLSLGNDGSLCVFRCRLSVGVHPLLQVECISKLTTLPIKTPDFLRQDPEGELYVGGFLGSQYIVLDITNKCEIYRREGGGWKRPHSVNITWLNGRHRITFASPVPFRNTSLLFVCDSIASKERMLCADENFQTALTLPRHLTGHSLGKIAYCSAFLVSGYFVDGGEEGMVKLYWDNGNEIKILQEVHMPHNVAVKALATCELRCGANRGLVLAAGGRLTYAIWSYDLNCRDECGVFFPLNFLLSTSCNGTIWMNASQDHRILCVACDALPGAGWRTHPEAPMPDVDVDNTERHPWDDSIYGIVLGDSRGVVTVARYSSHMNTITFSAPGLQRPKLSILEEFPAHDCPVVSCCTILLHPNSTCCNKGLDCHGKPQEFFLHIGIFGSTSGDIAVYLLSGSLLLTGEILQASRLLFSYNGHLMGANAVDAAAFSCDQEFDGSASTWSWGIVIASGGDDQALSTCRATFKVSSERKDAVEVEIDVIERANGSSGSAIKGLRCVVLSSLPSTTANVYCVGYDQRLSILSLQTAASGADPIDLRLSGLTDKSNGSTEENSGGEVPLLPVREVALFPSLSQNSQGSSRLTWLRGVPVIVGDVAAMDISICNKTATHAIVVGEGFQVFSLTS